jgi:hypothetical protein
MLYQMTRLLLSCSKSPVYPDSIVAGVNSAPAIEVWRAVVFWRDMRDVPTQVMGTDCHITRQSDGYTGVDPHEMPPGGFIQQDVCIGCYSGKMTGELRAGPLLREPSPYATSRYV